MICRNVMSVFISVLNNCLHVNDLSATIKVPHIG